MIEAFLQGLAGAIQPEALLYQIAGLLLGLIFGAIPGLSGIQALAILIPFTFTMEPNVAFSFLLGTHVATFFAGSITAILLNVPGTSTNLATCWDGHPMAKRGEASRALGISATSSAVGGVIGVLILVAVLPIMRPLIMALQPPEFFMVGLLGLTLIALLSSKSLIKGLVSGLLGLMFAFIGQDPVTGVTRYTFDSLHLLDGIDLIAVVCGLFAIGEMIKLFVEGGSVSKSKIKTNWSEVWEGIKTTFRHKFLLIRTSVIGGVIGAFPGVGGTVANVVAYGHAVQSSKNSETFGTGRPEGVIAPESANNAKEGPMMIPTIAFGIPGGEAAAVLLGAFLILGIQPGPEMVNEHLDLTFTIVWIIALSSVLASVIGLLIAGPLSRITTIPATTLTPLIIALGVLGAFASSGAMFDVYIALGFGVLGYFMRRYGYSEACLVIGLVLGTIVERNFQMATMIYGFDFILTRPISLIILLVICFTLIYPFFKRKFLKDEGKGMNL